MSTRFFCRRGFHTPVGWVKLFGQRERFIIQHRVKQVTDDQKKKRGIQMAIEQHLQAQKLLLHGGTARGRPTDHQ